MYKLFLSFRYFRSRPINVIPVICMMLGVTALIVILAVMDGFQAQLKKTLRGSLSDLIINVGYDSDFEEWEKVLAETEGVRAWSPHLQTGAVMNRVEPGSDDPGGGRGRRSLHKLHFSAIFGIDPRLEAGVSSFREYLRDRRRVGETPYTTFDPERPFQVRDPRAQTLIFRDTDKTEMAVDLMENSGVVLGHRLAELLHVNRPFTVPQPDGSVRYLYSRVCMTTAVEGEETENGGRPGRRALSTQQIVCPVTGIYESGNQEIDKHIAFMDRRVARRLFGLTRDPQEIRIELTDYESMKDVVREDLHGRRHEIFERTKKSRTDRFDSSKWPFLVRTWEDERRNFLNAIDNEKGLIAIIAGMVFIVTGFMIFSILSMIVTMKTRDIGILKALGGSALGITGIFLLNGLIIGVIGAGLGLGLGLLFVDKLNWIKEQLNAAFGWEPFPQNIYLFSEIPTRVMPQEVAAIVLTALLVGVIGAVLPAIRASGMDPVESLRHE